MIYNCHIERPGLRGLIDLKGEPADVLARLQKFGLSDPPPQRASAAGPLRVLRPAPSHWLLCTPLDAEDELLRSLLATEPQGDTLILPVSDAYAWFALRGPDARELMAVGCPLDLDPQVFAPDGATFTEVFGLKTLLWRSADGFELAIERSYDPLLTDWFVRIQGDS